MALISDLPNANPQKSDLMEIQNGQTSSNNSSVGQLMQLSASENLAPAYDANAGVYEVGDFVSYNGTLYQCNTAIATPEAFDATKWDAVKVTEITGEDIPVNTLTPDTSINSAINACFGRTGSDIPVSDSDSTSVADKLDTISTFTTHSDIISFSSAKTGYKDVAIPIRKIIPQGALLAADAGVPLVLSLQDLGNNTTRIRATSSTGTAYTSNVQLLYLTID